MVCRYYSSASPWTINPKDTKMNKKTLLVVVILVAALVAALIIAPKLRTLSEKTGKGTNGSDKEMVIQQEPAELMKVFPAGFPFEQGAQSTGSYQFIPAKSRGQQSTLTYISKKTLAENAQIFKTYLEKEGFKVTNKTEQKDLDFYYAAKDNKDLSILVQQKDNQVTVSVSYLMN
jgi:hypothetical protein